MNLTRKCGACISEPFLSRAIPLTVLFTALLLWSVAAIAKPVLEVVQLQHRQGLEIAEILKPVLKEGASASAMGSKLVIQADEADMPAIKAMIAKFDTATRNFQVTVKFVTTETVEKKDDAAALAATADGKPAVKGHAKRVMTTTVKETIQRAKIMENGWATFKLLESKPVTVVTTVTGKDGQKVEQTQTVAPVEATGFRVLPRLGGGKILLTIAAAGQTAPQPGNGVQTLSTETSVLVPENEWVSIGGSDDKSSQSEKSLTIPAIGFLQTEGMRNTTIEVKAELLD